MDKVIKVTNFQQVTVVSSKGDDGVVLHHNRRYKIFERFNGRQTAETRIHDGNV